MQCYLDAVGYYCQHIYSFASAKLWHPHKRNTVSHEFIGSRDQGLKTLQSMEEKLEVFHNPLCCRKIGECKSYLIMFVLLIIVYNPCIDNHTLIMSQH